MGNSNLKFDNYIIMKPNKTMNRKKYGTSKEGGENDADGSKEKIPLK